MLAFLFGLEDLLRADILGATKMWASFGLWDLLGADISDGIENVVTC